MIPLKVICTEEFFKNYQRLPQSVTSICDVQLKRLEDDADDPRLQRKKLKGHAGVYSIRVTRRYRALFYVNQSHEVIVFTVEHRKDVYR